MTVTSPKVSGENLKIYSPEFTINITNDPRATRAETVRVGGYLIVSYNEANVLAHPNQEVVDKVAQHLDPQNPEKFDDIIARNFNYAVGVAAMKIMTEKDTEPNVDFLVKLFGLSRS